MVLPRATVHANSSEYPSVFQLGSDSLGLTARAPENYNSGGARTDRAVRFGARTVYKVLLRLTQSLPRNSGALASHLAESEDSRANRTVFDSLDQPGLFQKKIMRGK
jgi:hypothetical protein